MSKCIWMERKHWNSDTIGFIGTNDSRCVASEVIRLAGEQGISMHVYEGANHSLDTGDILHDLDTMKEVMMNRSTTLMDRP